VSELQQRLIDGAERDGIEKLVVGAIVHDGRQVLIVRRADGDPFMPGIEELPSGGVEDGEDLLTALTRELTEEIGWTGPGPLTADPSVVSAFDYTSGSGRRARQFTFAVRYDGHDIELSAEHSGYRWVDAGDLARSDLTGETAQIIRAWAATRP
jgi:8-oxo-dGTP diphosphatase